MNRLETENPPLQRQRGGYLLFAADKMDNQCSNQNQNNHTQCAEEIYHRGITTLCARVARQAGILDGFR